MNLKDISLVGLQREKSKNRGWREALESQFPSLFGPMSNWKIFILAAALCGGLFGVWTGAHAGYQYYREEHLKVVDERLKGLVKELDRLLNEEGLDWFLDKRVAHLKSRIAQVAKEERRNFYGRRAAYILVARSGAAVDVKFRDRVLLSEKDMSSGNLKRSYVPETVSRLSLPPVLEMPFDVKKGTNEYNAYQEIYDWLHFVELNCTSLHKSQVGMELLYTDLARVCVALGEFDRAEEYYDRVQHPVGKVWAASKRLDLFMLKRDYKGAKRLIEDTISDIDALLAFGDDLLKEEESARIMCLKLLYSFRLEGLEAQERVADHSDFALEGGIDVV